MNGMFEGAGEQAQAAAAAWAPESMTQVASTYDELPPMLTGVAASIETLLNRTEGELPVEPCVVDALSSVVAALRTSASLCEEVPTTLRTAHTSDWERLDTPRTGEAMWDQSRNAAN